MLKVCVGFRPCESLYSMLVYMHLKYGASQFFPFTYFRCLPLLPTVLVAVNGPYSLPAVSFHTSNNFTVMRMHPGHERRLLVTRSFINERWYKQKLAIQLWYLLHSSIFWDGAFTFIPSYLVDVVMFSKPRLDSRMVVRLKARGNWPHPEHATRLSAGVFLKFCDFQY